MTIITFVDADGFEQTLDTSKPFNIAYHVDCREFMKAIPDKLFDLCCADPPYGDGTDSSQIGNVDREREKHPAVQPIWKSGEPVRAIQGSASSDSTEAGRKTRGRNTSSPERHYVNRGGWHGKYLERNGSPDRRDVGGEVRKKIIAWDVAPEKEVFDELFRVSQAQIVWGGNYFSLPPTRCFLIWRKLSISESFSMAMAEYAWTSFNANAKVFECAPQGKPNDPRFHATQKPIDLYRWIYGMFTKPGMTVFDPFLGSGSSRIAAYEAGLNFVGCEIDETYFRKQEERFERMTDNYSLFD